MPKRRAAGPPPATLPDGGVDVGGGRGHGAHAGLAAEGALLGALRRQRAARLRLAQLQARQDGAAEEPPLPLAPHQLRLAVRRQHEAPPRHGRAAAPAARAAQGHAGGQRPRPATAAAADEGGSCGRRGEGPRRTGATTAATAAAPVQEGGAVAVL